MGAEVMEGEETADPHPTDASLPIQVGRWGRALGSKDAQRLGQVPFAERGL